jgi:hypothetical protein
MKLEPAKWPERTLLKVKKYLYNSTGDYHQVNWTNTVVNNDPRTLSWDGYYFFGL